MPTPAFGSPNAAKYDLYQLTKIMNHTDTRQDCDVYNRTTASISYSTPAKPERHNDKSQATNHCDIRPTTSAKALENLNIKYAVRIV